jgi:hypothetical protein
MVKDISKVIEQYVYSHLQHRDDIEVQVTNTPKRYNVHIIVNLTENDGILSTMKKGVDRQNLMSGLRNYLNLDWDTCMITYECKQYWEYNYLINEEWI